MHRCGQAHDCMQFWRIAFYLGIERAIIGFGTDLVCNGRHALRLSNPRRKTRQRHRRRHPRWFAEARYPARRDQPGAAARRVAHAGARGAAAAHDQRLDRYAPAQGRGGLQGDARAGRESVRRDGRDGGDLCAARGHEHDADRTSPPTQARTMLPLPSSRWDCVDASGRSVAPSSRSKADCCGRLRSTTPLSGRYCPGTPRARTPQCFTMSAWWRTPSKPSPRSTRLSAD